MGLLHVKQNNGKNETFKKFLFLAPPSVLCDVNEDKGSDYRGDRTR
jgi:hypothetical protein